MKHDVPKACARYAAHWAAREGFGYGPEPLSYARLPEDVKRALGLGIMQVPWGRRDKLGRQIFLMYVGALDHHNTVIATTTTPRSTQPPTTTTSPDRFSLRPSPLDFYHQHI